MIFVCWAAGLLTAPLGVAASGELDSSFGRMGEFSLQISPACSGGCSGFVGSYAQTLALQADGKLLISGQDFENQGYAEKPRNVIVRLNGNGTLDGTFGSDGLAETSAFEVWHLYANADGDITSVGVNATDRFGGAVGMEHYTAFGSPIGAVQWFAVPFLAEDAEIDSKGRIVVLSETTPPLLPHGSEPKIVRFLPTGAADRSFGKGGMISLPASSELETQPSAPEAFALGKDGSVFVAATTYLRTGREAKAHTVLYSFTPSGKPDRSFGRSGMVTLPSSKGYEALALAVAPNGDVVLAAGEDAKGSSKRTRLLVVRYTKTGRLDNSFGSDGVAARTWDSISPDIVPSAVTFDARGDVVVAGSNTFTPEPGSGGNLFLARLTRNGFDCSFGADGVVLGGWGTSANSVAVQTNGRIVVVGRRNQEFTGTRFVGGGALRTCLGEGKTRKPQHKRMHSRKRRRRR